MRFLGLRAYKAFCWAVNRVLGISLGETQESVGLAAKLSEKWFGQSVHGVGGDVLALVAITLRSTWNFFGGIALVPSCSVG